MQDIDFDEIDRAVNSVTNTAPEVTPVVPEPTGEPLSQPVAPVPAVPSPAVRRSSGRFMDVVHPSSDMRPLTGSRSPAPSAPSLHREEVAERDEVVEPREAIEAISQPEPTAAPSTAFHWPDPIDSDEATLQPAPEVSEESPVVPEPEEVKNEDASPLESPFLTDAKVEKRPLGAFSGADADLPLLEDPISFSADTPPQPEVVADIVDMAHEEHEETLHELHPDLLALGSHNYDKNASEPLLEATNPPDPEPISVTEDVPTGPTSITQQYQEQPSTTAEVSGSIFDTEAYHQPLTHSTKKHSGVLIAVWIVALILVGAGIGAGIYFVLLPMLG